MTQEKFNDTMVRLRQAEENFNKALQDIQTVFNEYEKELVEKKEQARWEPWSFDNVVKETKAQKLQEKDDDYYKGLKDMHEALRLIATNGSDGGMSISELKDAFGMSSVLDIILGCPSEEIMDKVLAWNTKRKASQDQELRVGDEIEYMYPGRKPEKCIVVNLENGIGKEKIIWTIDLESFRLSWFSSNCYWDDTYHKTGKHYDSIPLKKEESDEPREIQ